jgi:hypothetical protein
MIDNTQRQLVADAIRRAAANNPHCSVIPGPVVAEIYAEAALTAINYHNQIVEPWHGKTTGQDSK